MGSSFVSSRTRFFSSFYSFSLSMAAFCFYVWSLMSQNGCYNSRHYILTSSRGRTGRGTKERSFPEAPWPEPDYTALPELQGKLGKRGKKLARRKELGIPVGSQTAPATNCCPPLGKTVHSSLPRSPPPPSVSQHCRHVAVAIYMVGPEGFEGCLSQTPMEEGLAAFSAAVCGDRGSLCPRTPYSFSTHPLAFPLGLPRFSSQENPPSTHKNPSSLVFLKPFCLHRSNS